MSDSINITIGSDWGCDHTDDDGYAYAEHVQSALETAYPGADVTVDYDRYAVRDTISIGDDDGQVEIDGVTEVMVQAWDSWCGACWPSSTAST